MDIKKAQKEQTKVLTITREDVEKVLEMGTFTEEEERYMRIRLGIGGAPSVGLPRRGQNFAETRAKLALMEASLIGSLPQQRQPSINPVKERIIERLKGK